MQHRNLIVFVAVSCLLAGAAYAACGVCMPNNLACLNETHFKFCFNGVLLENAPVLRCGSGEICTSLGLGCWLSQPGDLVEPACTKTDVNCRSCDSQALFVCTSRTTFQMCEGSVLSPKINTCPTGTVCSIDSGDFCVKKCQLPNDRYECDREAP